MSDKKRKKDESGAPSVIAKGCTIKGSVLKVSHLLVEGVLDGDVVDGGHLVVGRSGVINGSVSARTIINFGSISGDVFASASFSVKSTGVHNGKIISPRLAVEKGGVCSGRVVTAIPAGPNNDNV